MEVEKANLQETIHQQISKNQQTTEMESAQGNPEHCGTTKRKQPKNESWKDAMSRTKTFEEKRAFQTMRRLL